ncbi:class I SAM-dependent methyltransferase [Microbacterium sp. A93]|uniref:class I SAM-dependent methyltransferase n=1 Tax=Microbacterium sp. A93 TaxID=3450716 RepID=UPI003F42D50F
MTVSADDVGGAYDTQSARLADMLGTTVHPDDPDRALIEPWADGVNGRILDVGSGTGRWTGHLAGLGHDVGGIDPSEKFIEGARRAHPGIPFRVESVHDLAASEERWSGVLAWYSLIHLDPDDLRSALSLLHAVLLDGGSLLLSFFTGPQLEPFDHPVAPAYRWPTSAMSEALSDAGFRGVHQHDSVSDLHAAITATA